MADGNEYENEPVPEKAQLGFSSFLGMYAGEHTAGTEFMIGPLFVKWGASGFDLIVGLLLGNLLAVLTWRFLTAEIATSRRLTLYAQLERICGRQLVTLYNLANGLLFCFLAGSMVTVSATALGVPLGDRVTMPTFADKWPTGFGFAALCIVIGAVMTLVAVKGYSVVARVGQISAPWMFLVFVACGVVMVARLKSVDLMALMTPPPGTEKKITFLGVVAFSWFCNSAMHLGMSDLSVLRFAKHPKCGWASATGMFLGHYVAWICAALLLMYWVRERGATTEAGVPPGVMAFDAVGWAGIICVLIAGWTTANPTIYRAGLAFQGMFPKLLNRTTATIIAGGLCTIAGVFPAFAMKLLDFVGLYGTILAPIGAVIVVDHYLAQRVGITPEYAQRTGTSFNLAVLLSWAISVGIAMWALYNVQGVESFYLPLPAWLACGVLYILFSKFMNRPLTAADR